MPGENTVDLFVKHQFGELYLANLKYTLYKLRFPLIVALIILAASGYLLVYASSRTPDDHWVALSENLAPLFYVLIISLLLIPFSVLMHTRRILGDPSD